MEPLHGLRRRTRRHRLVPPDTPAAQALGHTVRLMPPALYGAFEVKHIFYTTLYFLHSSFFVPLGIPFLRTDPTVEADTHRAC